MKKKKILILVMCGVICAGALCVIGKAYSDKQGEVETSSYSFEDSGFDENQKKEIHSESYIPEAVE